MVESMSVPMTPASVARIYGVSQENVTIENGKIIIKFVDGEKTFDRNAVQDYCRAYCLVHQDEMNNRVDNARLEAQRTNASVQISTDGGEITYTILNQNGINVQDFMNLYNIKPGTLRPFLREAHIKAKEDAVIAHAKGEDTVEVTDEEDGSISRVQNLDVLHVVDEVDEGWGTSYVEYSDGVKERNKFYGIGGSEFDYTGVILQPGTKYTISPDDIKDIK